ncbi:MAG: DUF1080 domain-containing protein [Bacteroidales bacterium]|nr:DUF1080 domain-containing protein [Bacteroidales bacterium]
MKTIRLLAIALAVVLCSSCNQQGKPKADESQANDEVQSPVEPLMNSLSAEENSEGWVLLFDGQTTDGWKNFNEDEISGWQVEEGCLVGEGLGGDIGGDLVSVKEYDNFILKWEWKLGPNGNSGVMYHVVEDAKYKAAYETGPEYQMIEDDDFRDENGDPYPIEDWQKTAADYAMYVPNDQKQVNPRDWNSSKIVFSPEKAEYWLNGKKVLEFVPWSDDWNERRNSGKWDAYPDYGFAKTGKLCLQDHGSKVWFRNIKIKEL